MIPVSAEQIPALQTIIARHPGKPIEIRRRGREVYVKVLLDGRRR